MENISGIFDIMCFTALFPRYIPFISYYQNILVAKNVIIADNLQYVKRSSLNRYFINNERTHLTIPIIHDGSKKLINQKRIDYSENWVNKHLKNIYHTYHTFPYFDEYFKDISTICKRKHVLFIQLYKELLLYFLLSLKIKSKIHYLSDVGNKSNLVETLIHFAKKHNFAKYVVGSDNYPKPEFIRFFEANNIKIQKLSEEQNNTNILHLLFKHGPEAPYLIRRLTQL